MTDTTPLSPILHRAPLVDRQTLLISRPWSQWLEALYIRAGGVSAPSNVTLAESGAGHAEAIDALDTRLDAAEGAIVGLDTRLDAAEGAIVTLDATTQPLDATLSALAGLATGADTLPYFLGVDTAALTPLTPLARTLLDDTNTSSMQATLGLGTMAVQNASAVAITGGTLHGLTSVGIGLATPQAVLQIRSGKLVLDEGAYLTSKFDSQGVAWSAATTPAIVFNAGAAVRPEIAWIRGANSYPELAIREHATANVGGEFYSGTGTVAPTLTMVLSLGRVGVGGSTLTATLGAGASYQADNVKGSTLYLGQSSSNERAQALIAPAWVVSTDASRTARLTLSVYDATAAREGLRVETSGTAAMLGFYGGGAVAKPTITGSRGGNAALASLLTALASQGLITDSSTA